MLFIGLYFLIFHEGEEQLKGKFIAKDAVTSVPALNVGIIGLNTTEMGALETLHIPPSLNTGCHWDGRSPFCTPECGSDEVRYRTSAQLVEGEEGHGEPCWTGEKHFCCRRNTQDKTWAGIWQSTTTGTVYDCSFEARNSSISMTFLKCGSFACHFHKGDIHTDDNAEISGELCDVVHLFGKIGIAEPGVIIWENDQEVEETWLKL